MVFSNLFVVVSTDVTNKVITIKQYATKGAYIKQMHLMHGEFVSVDDAVIACRQVARRYQGKSLY